MGNFSATAYRKKREVSKETVEVSLPSGATFTLTKPDLAVYLISGRIPGALLNKIQGASGESGATDVFVSLPPQEQFAAMRFIGNIVKAACVEPKIVDEPQGDTEIVFEDLDDADILYIFRWAVGQAGGVEGDNLESFRN